MVTEFAGNDTEQFYDLVSMMIMLCGPLGTTLNHIFDYIIYEIIPSNDGKTDIMSYIKVLQNEYTPEEKCDDTNDQVNILFRWMKLEENKTKDSVGDRRSKREIGNKVLYASSSVDSWQILLCHVVLEEDLIQSLLEQFQNADMYEYY